MSMRVYGASEASLEPLRGRSIGVLGYGSQGSAHALNLRDSGMAVRVGQRRGSARFERAQADGFEVGTLSEVASGSDVVIMALPDESAADLYREHVGPCLRDGAALGFLHGFNITFGLIEPAAGIDTIMISPKGPGSLVRSTYVEGLGVPALMCIHRDATGRGREIALSWAAGIGATRAGVFETTFQAETVADLFGEQAVLCGGMSALMIAAFDTLVEAGYDAELAYFECIHEAKQIADLVYERGISAMREQISNTAEYGDLTRGPRLVDGAVREKMRKLLGEIESGEFAREWVAEQSGGLKRLGALFEAGRGHASEAAGERLRGFMPWLGGKEGSKTNSGGGS